MHAYALHIVYLVTATCALHVSMCSGDTASTLSDFACAGADQLKRTSCLGCSMCYSMPYLAMANFETICAFVLLTCVFYSDLKSLFCAILPWWGSFRPVVLKWDALQHCLPWLDLLLYISSAVSHTRHESDAAAAVQVMHCC